MATTTEPSRTRRSALAGGLAVAACLAACLLPLAPAGGLLTGLISAVRACQPTTWSFHRRNTEEGSTPPGQVIWQRALTDALVPAALLGLAAAGNAGAWWWRRRIRPAAATA